MVFQGTLLPAIGIMLTPWEPRMEVVLGIGMTLLAALWMRYLVGRGGILVWHLLINGLMYISYLVLVLS
jgi:cation:H+ antiporter